jgi:hypothetical protein
VAVGGPIVVAGTIDGNTKTTKITKTIAKPSQMRVGEGWLIGV